MLVSLSLPVLLALAHTARAYDGVRFPRRSNQEEPSLPLSPDQRAPRTNAERMALGLPPLKPHRRQTSNTAQTSATPPVIISKRCTLRMRYAATGDAEGRVGGKYSTLGVFGYDDQEDAPVEVAFSYTATTDPVVNDLELRMDSPPSGRNGAKYYYFGPVMVLGTGSFGSDPTAHGYITGIASTPPGSLPWYDAENIYSKTNGPVAARDSTTWSYNQITQELSLRWKQPGGGRTPLLMVRDYQRAVIHLGTNVDDINENYNPDLHDDDEGGDDGGTEIPYVPDEELDRRGSSAAWPEIPGIRTNIRPDVRANMDPSALAAASSSSNAPTVALPAYSPSEASPDYSVDPADDETTLDASPGHSTRRRSTGIYTKSCGSATVVLLNQPTGARTPTYGRAGVVDGSLILDKESTSAIVQISIRLQGRLEITTSGTGGSTTKVVSVDKMLWDRETMTACPDTLNFQLVFPETFQDGDQTHPLPPTWIARFPGFPSLYAKATYHLGITIVKERRLGFLPKTKLIHIPLEYAPAYSPPRGIAPQPEGNFLATIKHMPEEWFQSSFVMKTRAGSGLPQIHCQVFIPSVRIFGIEDTIPVHVQLSGTYSSLRHLLAPPKDAGPASPSSSALALSRSRSSSRIPLVTAPPPALPADPAPNSASSSGSSSDRSSATSQLSPVRVSLNRFVSVDHFGRQTRRSLRISATARIQALPPTATFDCAKPDCAEFCDECAEYILVVDWAGQVRCDPSLVEVGGFSVGALSVKDYLTVELAPPNAQSSPLVAVQHAIPVRFVTDSYRDTF
ncbi:hypothetical protein MKEN_00934700 [Mycena kentingensis (nom. inval.)]|nr:hypothetical protein MKEN_00934700 [Mycena kentingensis (nom. inval.)]